MSLLVLILFILILLGGLPHFGHHSYGSRPPGLAGVLDVALAVPARTTPADAWSTWAGSPFTRTRTVLDNGSADCCSSLKKLPSNVILPPGLQAAIASELATFRSARMTG